MLAPLKWLFFLLSFYRHHFQATISLIRSWAIKLNICLLGNSTYYEMHTPQIAPPVQSNRFTSSVCKKSKCLKMSKNKEPETIHPAIRIRHYTEATYLSVPCSNTSSHTANDEVIPARSPWFKIPRDSFRFWGKERSCHWSCCCQIARARAHTHTGRDRLDEILFIANTSLIPRARGTRVYEMNFNLTINYLSIPGQGIERASMSACPYQWKSIFHCAPEVFRSPSLQRSMAEHVSALRNKKHEPAEPGRSERDVDYDVRDISLRWWGGRINSES